MTRTCWIIAGPNGAGKTTFALEYLPTVVGCSHFINADLIAAGLSPLAPERELLAASRLFLREIEERIAARENFASWKDLTWNRALVLVDVVEAAPMEAGKVTVDAEAMGRDLGSGGRAALYGLSFDSNSATLTAQSDPTLAEIARLLSNRPELKLYVVGHTDNVGDLAFNLDLSKRRAEAVVAALTSRYKVDPSRLQAQGVGPLSPLAPNDGEPGRALNRRVELVPR